MAKDVFTGTMVERNEPKFISFTQGDSVEGLLLVVERLAMKGKPVNRYTVEMPNGEAVCFLGTYQIDVKLRTPQDLGHYVRVVCKGEDSTKAKEGGNAMKVFAVKVSEKKVVLNAHGLYITDDDVPEFSDGTPIPRQ